ncbi:response regulator, partial [Rubrivirga sp.]|uniref:response regulator n=1 Tax=Rubrivirga sp. TaxID=1885344 RepID=UPI003C78FCE3
PQAAAARPPEVSAPAPVEAPADKPLGVVIPMDDIVPQARVLLAEDNPINQKVTSLTLRRLGYRPEVVSDGAQAVDSVRTGAYDVVLMDIMMPVMDGLQATAAIHHDCGPHPRPAIVALTANAMEGDRQNCLDAGCDDYLAKPVAPEDLAATIERAIRERSEGAVA